MTELKFEDCKKIICYFIKEKGCALEKIYNICPKANFLIEEIIDRLEKGKTESKLSDIDMINAIRINQILPFLLLEDKYKDLDKFIEAWLLVQQNYINMTGENNLKLLPSVQTISKLLHLNVNFNKLIYMSEYLLNKYEYIENKASDMESYNISKLYIDKILKQDTEEKED